MDRAARRVPSCCLLLFCLALPAAVAGCGGHGTYPVRGRVVFKGSDAPAKELAGYTITLLSSGESGQKVSASGVVQPDGTFALSTFGKDDGAMPGKHTVAITAPMQMTDEAVPAPLVDSRYAKPETSGLEITVDRGKNDVTLTVERASEAVKPPPDAK